MGRERRTETMAPSYQWGLPAFVIFDLNIALPEFIQQIQMPHPLQKRIFLRSSQIFAYYVV